MNRPLVSIVVPCYNRFNYLSETLDSVRKQTYENIECIVVNDYSTEYSDVQINKSIDCDKRFKVVQNNGPKGAQMARTVGLKLCKGEYINFLDSDDLLKPNCIEKKVEYLATCPKVDVLSSFSQLFNSKNECLEKYIWEPKGQIFERLIKNETYVDMNSGLIRKGALICYQFDPSIIAFQELDLHLTLSSMGFEYDTIPEILTMVRQHPNRMVANNVIKQRKGRLIIQTKWRSERIKILGVIEEKVAFERVMKKSRPLSIMLEVLLIQLKSIKWALFNQINNLRQNLRLV